MNLGHKSDRAELLFVEALRKWEERDWRQRLQVNLSESFVGEGIRNKAVSGEKHAFKDRFYLAM